jgi:hypothetical protein
VGKVAEFDADRLRIGSIVERIVKPLNPEGFIEFQLRQTVTDAIKEIGRERAMEIIREAAE